MDSTRTVRKLCTKSQTSSLSSTTNPATVVTTAAAKTVTMTIRSGNSRTGMTNHMIDIDNLPLLLLLLHAVSVPAINVGTPTPSIPPPALPLNGKHKRAQWLKFAIDPTQQLVLLGLDEQIPSEESEEEGRRNSRTAIENENENDVLGYSDSSSWS